MKTVLFFLFAALNVSIFAQFADGYNKQEVRDMIALCNSYTFLDLYNSDAEIIPHGYEKIYTSGIFGMDNKYQIYRKGNVAVINLRGSTDKKASWLENINSAMIPAKGRMKISGEYFQYCFAKDINAAVHSGYALGIAFLSKDILYHIKSLNLEGVYHFIITGHSQGGSLANMLRAYLENLTANDISKGNKFKTYSFAAPMVGNKNFTEEYKALYAFNNSSFNIVNPDDAVPTFPLNYNNSDYMSDNLKTLFSDKESFSFKKMMSDGVVLLFENGITKSVKSFSTSVNKQIEKDLGPVELPPYVEDINYQRLESRIEIQPAVFPKMLKDSSILKNETLMHMYMRDPNGNFYNEELYAKESWTYQHKPYNYYVSILKMYFPDEYALLKRKFLRENVE
jgi:hypothetical protein